MTEFVELDCSDCGEPVEMPRPMHTECSDVEIEAPKPEDLERAIPESDLRELVEEWREDAEKTPRGFAGGLEMASEELEQVLEE